MSTSAKNFGPIESDYQFFMDHSTESENDIRDYRDELADIRASNQTIRLLDFGCGDGQFTRDFLNALDFPAHKLYLTLLEPVTAQREMAQQNLVTFTQHPIIALDNLESSAGDFDLILCNHVLYYVEDLPATASLLLKQLSRSGKLVVAMAGWDNFLINIWKIGFSLLHQPVPFAVADDLRQWLDSKTIGYTMTKSDYQLNFPDTIDNRNRLLRFLFERHFDKLPREPLMAVFDQCIQKQNIHIDTHSYHFLIEPLVSPANN